MTYYKHVVTATKVAFMTYYDPDKPTQFITYTKQQWLDAGRPDTIEKDNNEHTATD